MEYSFPTLLQSFLQLHDVMHKVSEANHRLRKLNEAKREFLNIAAHDFAAHDPENPLCGIRGHTKLLTMPEPPEAKDSFVRTSALLADSRRWTCATADPAQV